MGGLSADGTGPCGAGPCVPVGSIYVLVVVVAGCETEDVTTMSMSRAGPSQVSLLPHRHCEDDSEDDDKDKDNELLGDRKSVV